MVRPGWISAGNFGVDVFFAISGFVMVLSSQRLFGQPGASRSFLTRRLIRIVPLYWAALLFMAVWGLRFPPAPDAASLVHAFAFVPYASNTANGRIVPPLEVGWTLNYEMLFYILFALCLGRTARATVGRVAALLCAIVVVGSVVPLPVPFASWTSPIILEFAGGMVIALAYNGGVRLPAAARLGLVFLAVPLVFAQALGLDIAIEGWVRLLVWGVAAWFVLAAATLAPASSDPWAPRFWNAGGDISYALYLLHMPVMIVGQMVWRHFKWPYGAMQEVLFVIATTSLSVLAAVVAHRLFEKPLTRWLNRRFAPSA
jgi:peptidoglycan/LPS O-acetylase OafA/YrhL